MLLMTLLYALGKYTPAFWAMYEIMPGVSLYRRPADATFPFGLMLAICGGYLVHRWLMASVPPPARWQRIVEIVVAIALVGGVGRACNRDRNMARGDPSDPHRYRGRGLRDRRTAAAPIVSRRRNALAAAAVLALFSTADLRLEQRPE